MAKSTKSPAIASSDDWQVEDDLLTLIRAKEIEKDPKRLAKARALAKQKMLDVAQVAADNDD
jgi:hypothetical protein